jgi:hypothetical protein
VRGARDRRERSRLGERERLAVGRRPIAEGQPVEHRAGLERDDLVAANLTGDRVPRAGRDERGEPHLDG